jgi:hypothetical protein
VVVDLASLGETARPIPGTNVRRDQFQSRSQLLLVRGAQRVRVSTEEQGSIRQIVSRRWWSGRPHGFDWSNGEENGRIINEDERE